MNFEQGPRVLKIWSLENKIGTMVWAVKLSTQENIAIRTWQGPLGGAIATRAPRGLAEVRKSTLGDLPILVVFCVFCAH